jgi:predicted protein tyrosine phosphatase
MHIFVLNEEQIQKINPYKNHIVISIQDPKCDFVPLINNDKRLDYLGLKFHDVDDLYIANFNDWCEERNITSFTKENAQTILNFVEQWKDYDIDIYINCCAGISRSAGVAGALSKIYKEEDEYYFKHYCPNRYVYRTILNTYYEIK